MKQRVVSLTFQITMNDVLAVQIVETFQNFDDEARDEALRQFAECLEGLLERAVLDVSVWSIPVVKATSHDGGRKLTHSRTMLR